MSRLIIEKILDLARWAPSGDNTQPWRFEIVSDNQIAIHGFDTRQHVLYDFDGHASHMAHGALLETLRLAATRFGLQAEWRIRPTGSDELPIYDVTLTPTDIGEDPLVGCIESRTVQRRAIIGHSPRRAPAKSDAAGDAPKSVATSPPACWFPALPGRGRSFRRHRGRRPACAAARRSHR